MTVELKADKGGVKLDARLRAKLRRAGGLKSDAEALSAAAKEYIALREPKGPHANLLKLFGKIDFHPDWDPRQMRGKAQ